MQRPAESSPFGGSDELRALTDEIVNACEAIAPDPAASVTVDGFNATRSVKVVLDGSSRVRSVTVNGGWRTWLDADRLGPAIVEAVQDAAVRRFRAWGESVVGGRARKAPQFTPPPPAMAAVGDPTSRQAQRALAELLDTVAGAMDALSDLEHMIEQRATQEIVGRAPNRTVAVTLRGGSPVSVDLDRQWLARATAASVSQLVTRAFDAAYEAYGDPTAEEFAEDGPLGRVLALGSDPAALMRRLGLTE